MFRIKLYKYVSQKGDSRRKVNDKQQEIINDTRDKNALQKAFKYNSPEGLFLQPQNLCAERSQLTWSTRM